MLIKQTGNRLFLRIIQISLFFSCLFVTRNSFSIDSLQLFVERGSIIEQVSTEQLSITLDLFATPVKLQIDLSRLELPQPYKNITKLDISCDDFSFEENKLRCDKGRLSFKGLHKGIAAQKITSADFVFEYNSASDALNLSLKNINIGAGKLSFQYQLKGDKWQTTFNAKNLDYKFFNHYVKHYFYQENMADAIDKLEDAGAMISFSGQASGTLSSKTDNEGRLDAVKLKGKLKNVHYQYGDDLAEKLAFDFSFSLTQTANRKLKPGTSPSGNYQVSLSIDAHQGEIIQNDIYVVLNGNERIRAQFNYRNNNLIDFSRFDIISKGFFAFKSRGKVLLNDDLIIHQLDTQIDIKNLSEFNQAYLNNVLSGTDYEELQIEGGIAAKVEKNKDGIKIQTQFKDFSLALNEELSLLDLNGKIHWNNIRKKLKQKSSPVPESQLSWQELTLNHLPLGASTFNFITHNDYLQLTQEVDIPIFDGALHINSLEISQIFPQPDLQSSGSQSSGLQKNGLTLTIDGMIKPVSLGLLSSHFEWPLLDGTLSAVIPATTYNEKYLTVGGALMLQVFDGMVVVKDLKIVEPLQDYAQLFANIDLNNLNLKSLTKTYNFGEIEGRVEGKLAGLELSAWEPVAFDAYIRTPENDSSSHRISQRAIDNLSSLGGASGLLSRSFLSFFETFRYDKIGLSCKLKNNICHMSGVEAKGSGYYIVKGGGIPRIDVMGFQRQVNWQVLTSRLKAIQLANEAVIE